MSRITRSECPACGRKVRVHHTPEGRRLLADLKPERRVVPTPSAQYPEQARINVTYPVHDCSPRVPDAQSPIPPAEGGAP